MAECKVRLSLSGHTRGWRNVLANQKRRKLSIRPPVSHSLPGIKSSFPKHSTIMRSFQLPLTQFSFSLMILITFILLKGFKMIKKKKKTNRKRKYVFYVKNRTGHENLFVRRGRGKIDESLFTGSKMT